jgi:fatty acid desaturase
VLSRSREIRNESASQDYSRGMRLAMRVLFVLAIPGVVFGWLTRVPPLHFDMEFDFFAYEVGWIDVLAALMVAAAVVLFVVVVVFVLVRLGVGAEQRPSRRAER